MTHSSHLCKKPCWWCLSKYRWRTTQEDSSIHPSSKERTACEYCNWIVTTLWWKRRIFSNNKIIQENIFLTMIKRFEVQWYIIYFRSAAGLECIFQCHKHYKRPRFQALPFCLYLPSTSFIFQLLLLHLLVSPLLAGCIWYISIGRMQFALGRWKWQPQFENLDLEWLVVSSSQRRLHRTRYKYWTRRVL